MKKLSSLSIESSLRRSGRDVRVPSTESLDACTPCVCFVCLCGNTGFVSEVVHVSKDHRRDVRIPVFVGHMFALLRYADLISSSLSPVPHPCLSPIPHHR